MYMTTYINSTLPWYLSIRLKLFYVLPPYRGHYNNILFMIFDQSQLNITYLITQKDALFLLTIAGRIRYNGAFFCVSGL